MKALLLGCELAAKIQETLALDKKHTYIWSDSQVALYWVKSCPGSWKTWVGNRVAKAQELFDARHFFYVPTNENVADHISRGLRVADLKKESEWFYGPYFLQESSECWPEQPDLFPTRRDEAVKTEYKPFAPIVLTNTVEDSFLARIFDRTWSHVHNIRTLAYIVRYKAILRNKSPPITRETPLSREDMLEAEKLWVIFVQQSAFPLERKSLKPTKRRKEPKLNKDSPLANLFPYFDSKTETLRVGGRLDQAQDLSNEAKHPHILPAGNKYVKQYILETHKIWSHEGVALTLCRTRAKYWIVRGRREVKAVLRACTCYRLRSKPFYQQMAPYPKERVTPSPAWTHCGADFVGPCLVRVPPRKPARKKKDKEEKEEEAEICNFYILLFTCLSSRAAHFEVTNDMTTNSVISALKRFIARKGMIRTLTTDNAKTFLKADRDLKKLWTKLDFEKIQKFALNLPERVEWQFITARAPHQAGCWERIVGAMKSTLKASFGSRMVSEEEFRTSVALAEMMVNSRPLNYVSDDVSDTGTLVTPAHLTLGRSLQTLPDSYCKDDLQDKVAVKWRKRQRIEAEFWKRWTHFYLLALLPAQKWTVEGRAPKVGDRVLVADSQRKKCDWLIARITKVILGRDNKPRTVQLHAVDRLNMNPKVTDRSDAKISHFARDLRYCYRLELDEPWQDPLETEVPVARLGEVEDEFAGHSTDNDHVETKRRSGDDDSETSPNAP
jgi:hypothetical protein